MSLNVITDNLLYFLIGAYPYGPLGGLALTVLLSIGSALGSAMVGLLLGIGLYLCPKHIRYLLRCILAFFRAIPVLLLIFWTYFLLPIFLGWDVPGTATVVVALTLIGGSYLAHSVYAGICSLPEGQWDAAMALGLSPLQAMRVVILPQALPIMVPSFINQWVSLIKDTSLAYVIGVSELSFVATQVNNREMVFPAEIFLFVAMMYYVLCASIEFGANYLTRRLSRHLAT